MKLTRRDDGASDAGSTPHDPSIGSPNEEQNARDAHGLRPGIEGLLNLMDRLLAPDGCPWDRAQSLTSLRRYLLEEAHEVLEAMDDPLSHRDELGDLLFQIVFQSALRAREGHFGFDDVVEAIRTKMVRRHPHVFGPQADPSLSIADVEQQWEARKRAERAPSAPRDALGSVPKGLPALLRASRLQDKAGQLGFDWPNAEGVFEKLDEELRELHEARESGDPSQIFAEYGDVLFVMVRLAQKLGLEAEEALAAANRKFERRFSFVLERCDEAGIAPETAGLAALEAFWAEAKIALSEIEKATGVPGPRGP